jgi:hypothetical protein
MFQYGYSGVFFEELNAVCGGSLTGLGFRVRPVLPLLENLFKAAKNLGQVFQESRPVFVHVVEAVGDDSQIFERRADVRSLDNYLHYIFRKKTLAGVIVRWPNVRPYIVSPVIEQLAKRFFHRLLEWRVSAVRA